MYSMTHLYKLKYLGSVASPTVCFLYTPCTKNLENHNSLGILIYNLIDVRATLVSFLNDKWFSCRTFRIAIRIHPIYIYVLNFFQCYNVRFSLSVNTCLLL